MLLWCRGLGLFTLLELIRTSVHSNMFQQVEPRKLAASIGHVDILRRLLDARASADIAATDTGRFRVRITQLEV